MKIGIDIDNVITNTNEYMIEKAKKYNIENNIDTKMKEDAISIKEMFSWTDEINKDFENKYLRQMNKEVSCKKNVQEILFKLKEDGNQIILITRRGKEHYPDCREITLEWLKENKILYDKFISDICEKGKKCVEENIDIFIDDEPLHCNQVRNEGIEVLMFTSIFNKKINKYDRINNWNELYNKIKSYTVQFKK